MPPGPGPRRAILVSTVSVLAGGLASLVASLLLRVLMARALDPASLGLVLLAIALVTPVGAIAGLGTNPALAQRVAERRARGEEAEARFLARKGLLLAGASGALAAAALALLSPAAELLLGQPGLERALLPIAPVALGLAAGGAALGIARGSGDSVGRAVVRDAGGGLLRVLGVGAVLLSGSPSVAGIAGGFAAGSLLAELLFVAYAAGQGWIARADRPAPEPLFPLLRPHAATEVLTQAGLWLDIVVLGALAPPAVVGLYGVARGLTRVLDLVRQASSHGYLPTASALVARGEEARLPALHVGTRRFAFALVWPVLAVCLLAPEPLLGLLFGQAYLPAAPALRLLALGSFLASFFDYLDLLLLAERRPVDVLRTGLGGAAALLVLLVLLVPRFGGEGAAAALLGAGLLRGLLLFRQAFRFRPARPFLPAATLPALLAAASLLAAEPLVRLLQVSRVGALLVAGAAGGVASTLALVSFLRARDAGGDPAQPRSAPPAQKTSQASAAK